MEVREEEFEFDTQAELLKQVTSFLDFKNKHGKFKEKKDYD